jgi:hypothetical protein
MIDEKNIRLLSIYSRLQTFKIKQSNKKSPLDSLLAAKYSIRCFNTK